MTKAKKEARPRKVAPSKATTRPPVASPGPKRLGRPPLNGPGRQRLSLNLDAGIHDQIRHRAAASGQTISAYTEALIKKGLG